MRGASVRLMLSRRFAGSRSAQSLMAVSSGFSGFGLGGRSAARDREAGVTVILVA